MSEEDYNAENLCDYIDNLCDDLKDAIHDLNNNQDDESYKRVMNFRIAIAQLSDDLSIK